MSANAENEAIKLLRLALAALLYGQESERVHAASVVERYIDGCADVADYDPDTATAGAGAEASAPEALAQMREREAGE